MSRFETLLRRYRKKTECEPPNSIESKVLERVRAARDPGFLSYLASPARRPAAMAVGVAIGVLTVAAPPFAASAGTPLPELVIFAPDAPYLPSNWLDHAE